MFDSKIIYLPRDRINILIFKEAIGAFIHKKASKVVGKQIEWSSYSIYAAIRTQLGNFMSDRCIYIIYIYI